MDCNQIDGKYYFRFMNLYNSAKNKTPNTEAELREFFEFMLSNKSKIKNSISDSEMLDLIKSAELTDNITNYTYTKTPKPAPKPEEKKDGSKNPGTPITTPDPTIDTSINNGVTDTGTSVNNKTPKNTTDIRAVVTVKVEPILDELVNMQQFASKYFRGYNIQFSEFLRRFGADMFGKSFVDFQNGKIIRTAEELDESVRNYYQERLQNVADYLRLDPKDAISQFDNYLQSNNITNVDIFNNEILQDVFEDYITVKHFNDLVKHQLKGLVYVDDLGRYNFGDVSHRIRDYKDSMDIVDEMTALSKVLIQSTQKIGADGKYIKNSYLTNAEVTGFVGKLKNIKKLAETLRFSPDENIKTTLEHIIINNQSAKDYGLDLSDMTIARTLYNAYYKMDGDALAGRFKNGVSILQMYSNMIGKNLESVESYQIVNAITSLLDKTVKQDYMTVKMERDDIKRELTTDLTVGKYINSIKSNLDNSMNVPQKFSHDASNQTKIANVGISINDDNNIVLSVRGATYEISKDGNSALEAVLTGADIRGSKDNDLILKDIVDLAQDLLNINYKQSGYRLAADTFTRRQYVNDVLRAINRIVRGRELSHNIHLNAINDDNEILNLANNQGFDYKKGRLTAFYKPFDSEEKDFTGLYKNTSISIANSKGDNYKQVSKNLNNDAIPNNSLLSLVFDYKTAIAQAKDYSDKGDAIKSNLFVHKDNKNVIKGVVMRQDVEDIEGAVKTAKNFTEGEHAYQSVLSDFWGSARDSVISLQPINYSDKPGQVMVSYDLNTEIEYFDAKNTKKKMTLAEMMSTPSEYLGEGFSMMDEFHLTSGKRQNKAIYDKLVADYEFLLESCKAQTQNGELMLRLTAAEAEGVDLFGQIELIIKHDSLENYRKFNGHEIDIQKEFHYTGAKTPNNYIIDQYNKYNNKEIYKRRINRANKKFASQFKNMVGDLVVTRPDGQLLAYYDSIIKALAKTQGITDTDEVNKFIDDYAKNWINSDGTLKISGNDLATDPKNIYKDDIAADLNPLFSAFQSSHRLLSQNFNRVMVGSEHAHVIKERGVRKYWSTFDPHNSSYETNANNYIYNDIYQSMKSLHPRYNKQQLHDATMSELWAEFEEGARLSAMLKRMVSYQAKLHPITQDLIVGIPKNVRMAVMADVSKRVFNSTGEEKGFDVSDGGGWIPPVAAIFMKNSIGDAGTDSVTLKAIRHALDPDTNVAHLDKYAVQAISNEISRGTELATNSWNHLLKFMYSAVDFHEVGINGNLFDLLINNTTNYNIDEGNINTWANSEESNNLPSFLKPVVYYNNNQLVQVLGVASYVDANGIRKYAIKKRVLGNEGYLLEQGAELLTARDNSSDYVKTVELNNIWDLWTEVLGGAYTVKQDINGSIPGGYSYDEQSNYALAAMMNNVIIKKTDKWDKEALPGILNRTKPTGSNIYNQTNYYQPLKDAIVWQVNNNTGMKNGVKNINKNTLILGDESQRGYFVTNTMWWGVQGNFDHGFDEEDASTVTEPTQLISACENLGYMSNDVKRMYQSIATIIKMRLGHKFDAYAAKDGSLYEILAREFMKQMEVEDRLGLANVYTERVNEILKERGIKLKDEDAADIRVSLSDSNFYGKLISSISGGFNRGIIRRNTSGIGSVLSQGHNAIMIVDTNQGTDKSDVLSKKFELTVLNNKYNPAKDEAGNHILMADPNGKSLKYWLAVKNVRDVAIAKYNEEKQAFTRAMQTGQYGNYATESELAQIENADGSISLAINPYDTLRFVGANGYIDFEISSLNDYYAIRDGRRGDIQDGKLQAFLAQNPEGVELRKLSGIPRNLKPAYLQFKIGDAMLSEVDLDSAWVLYNLKDAREGRVKLEGHYAEIYEQTKDADEDRHREQLIKYQEKEIVNLKRTGQVYYKGQLYSGVESTVSPGEVILSNVNAYKYDLEPNMRISEVNAGYFRSKYDMKQMKRKADKAVKELEKEGLDVKQISYRKYNKNIYRVSSIGESFDSKEVKTTTILDGVEYYTIDNKIIHEKNAANKLYKINGKYVTTADTSDINNDTILFSSYTDDTNEDIAVDYNAFIDELTNSWDHQLKLLGTRIPTQALQSIMAMKVVGFTETSINRAYVPVKKNWLDGSKK
jgi:hypothetical protein